MLCAAQSTCQSISGCCAPVQVRPDGARGGGHPHAAACEGRRQGAHCGLSYVSHYLLIANLPQQGSWQGSALEYLALANSGAKPDGDGKVTGLSPAARAPHLTFGSGTSTGAQLMLPASQPAACTSLAAQPMTAAIPTAQAATRTTNYVHVLMASSALRRCARTPPSRRASWT